MPVSLARCQRGVVGEEEDQTCAGALELVGVTDGKIRAVVSRILTGQLALQVCGGTGKSG
jgi:uncharacterized protein (DUF169 family)